MKLSWANFEKRVIELHVSWRLSIRAVKGFKGSGEALDSYLTEDYQDFISILAEAAKKIGKKVTIFPAYKTFDKFKPKRAKALHRELKTVIQNIHAAYLVNFAAILEEHIKQCARVLLLDNPQMLDPQRQVPLGKLISMDKDKVILQEVERYVQSLDRYPVEKRVNFFKEKFGIDFFGGPGEKLLKSLVDKRNVLLHEEPGTGASESDVDLAFFICFSVGTWLLMQINAITPELVIGFSGKSYQGRILRTFPLLNAYKSRRNDREIKVIVNGKKGA